MYMYVEQYMVQTGDTLFSIAKRFNLITYRQLLPVNPQILNPNLIFPGQMVNIPKLVPMNTYVVRPGDTLGNLIYHYNREHIELYGYPITINEVLAYNPGIINPNLIYPYMVIYLPEFL